MNRFLLAVAVVSTVALSSLFASPAVAANVHKTVVVHPNGNVTKKFTYGPVHHPRAGVIVTGNGVILRTPAIGIRIGR